MRILIAGARGQLGRSLQTFPGSQELTPLERDRLDITDLKAVREAIAAYHPDLVINAAAYNNVDGAESDADGAYRLNARGPRNLAAATAESGIPVLHVSSDYVFDGTSNVPYHEYHRPNPISVYGCSKLAGEAEVRALNERHYIVRTAWLYHEIGENFPNRMLKQRERPQVRVVSDQSGSPTYAPHLAKAIGRLVTTGAYGTYHFAGCGGTSFYELTVALYRHLGIEVPVIPVTTAEFPRPAARPPYSVLATLQEPQILLPPWEEGLAEYASALKK